MKRMLKLVTVKDKYPQEVSMETYISVSFRSEICETLFCDKHRYIQELPLTSV